MCPDGREAAPRRLRKGGGAKDHLHRHHRQAGGPAARPIEPHVTQPVSLLGKPRRSAESCQAWLLRFTLSS
jgi:hypothetical protein